MTPEPTLILLHSLGLDGCSWAPFVEALSPRIRGIPVDLLGHGTASELTYSADAAATDVMHAARSAGVVGPVHLVGSGLGALTAVTLAARYPTEVGSMVLAGWPPSPGVATGGHGQSRAEAVAADIEANGPRDFANRYLEQLGAEWSLRNALADAMVIASTNGLIPGIAAAEGWRPTASATEALPPSLVVRGEHDVRTSEQAATVYAQSIGGVFATIEGAGHLAYVDRPIAFAEKVSDFHAGLA